MRAQKASREASSTRRTTGIHVKGRAEDVVRRVLDATIEELGRVGYASLKVDTVAATAGVHKTSVYRRWATREALVAAALERENDDAPVYDTGDLRADLLSTLHDLEAKKRSPRSRGILRMVQFERGHEEVDRILKRLRAGTKRRRHAPFERAIERGILPKDTPVDLLSDMIHAPLVWRIIISGEAIDEAYLEGLVDIALAGVMNARQNEIGERPVMRG